MSSLHSLPFFCILKMVTGWELITKDNGGVISIISTFQPHSSMSYILSPCPQILTTRCLHYYSY